MACEHLTGTHKNSKGDRVCNGCGLVNPRRHSWRGRKHDVKCRHCGMTRKHLGGGVFACQTKDGKALVGSVHECPPDES